MPAAGVRRAELGGRTWSWRSDAPDRPGGEAAPDATLEAIHIRTHSAAMDPTRAATANGNRMPVVTGGGEKEELGRAAQEPSIIAPHSARGSTAAARRDDERDDASRHQGRESGEQALREAEPWRRRRPSA